MKFKRQNLVDKDKAGLSVTGKSFRHSLVLSSRGQVVLYTRLTHPALMLLSATYIIPLPISYYSVYS